MSAPIPETHEQIREEDIEETLQHLADRTNTRLPAFTQEHLDWIRHALTERRHLCAHQYLRDGRCDDKITKRLKVLDQHINSLSPAILKVLHYLSRVRAIIPALKTMEAELQLCGDDEETDMLVQMKYQCSKAEVSAAIEGLSEYAIRPGILANDEF